MITNNQENPKATFLFAGNRKARKPILFHEVNGPVCVEKKNSSKNAATEQIKSPPNQRKNHEKMKSSYNFWNVLIDTEKTRDGLKCSVALGWKVSLLKQAVSP